MDSPRRDNPVYAAFFLKAEGRPILDDCAKDGTTVTSIGFDRFKTYPLRLAPEPEQVRIVSKIEELFSSIGEGERALERVRTLVERYRQSVLKAAVTGEPTWEWREQHAGELESGEALITDILEARRKAWETTELTKMTAKKQRPADERWKERYKEPEVPNADGVPELPSRWVWLLLISSAENSETDFRESHCINRQVLLFFGSQLSGNSQLIRQTSATTSPNRKNS